MPGLIDVRFCLEHVDELLAAPGPMPARKDMSSWKISKATTHSADDDTAIDCFSAAKPQWDILVLLPAELALAIFEFLDPVSLARARGVSTRYQLLAAQRSTSCRACIVYFGC